MESSEMPGCIIWDGDDDVVERTANKWTRELNLDLELYCEENENIKDVPAYVRLMLADVEKAMGVDRRWDGLAYETHPKKSVPYYDLRDKIIGVGIYTFIVKYRTVSYNPYEQ
jgi:hypothetical protein